MTRNDAAVRVDHPYHRGTNQSGMRDYNERLVLSLVRIHGGLSKIEISRMTGLSAQTVSVIMRELEAEGLLLRGEPVRGRIGQPSVPMSLNPDGAFFLGLKVGRRSSELVLLDFLGKLRSMRHNAYAYPTPSGTIDFVLEGIERISESLTPEQNARIAGLGIAIPFELWNWADASGAPREVMDRWRDTDIAAEITARCPFPVYLQNDATSACGAELVFGTSGAHRDFLYFYIGAFVGGGIVLNRGLYGGATGNAGALGSMPVPAPGGGVRQLIDIASITVLEATLAGQGLETGKLWSSPEEWGEIGKPLDKWIDEASSALAHAILSASAVVDFEAAIIEGWMPLSVRKRLVETTSGRLARLDSEGLKPPIVKEGTVGIHARALGGASLPLSDRFLIGSGAAMKNI
ncbi:ROK family transcriptional regulator [Aquamicrobium sp. LC103]|uniref:ROK family transcriptional regulator n=1 Tax=Aquamicrobium sp. LC103 TaxID=1120658 RepID=UPI00063E6E5C|nr:ROK family transcriptional regulator [Aquamicrobium sp. LC103]